MKIFDSTLIYPIFDVESIGDGPRVPRAHLEVVLTQLLAAPGAAGGVPCEQRWRADVVLRRRRCLR